MEKKLVAAVTKIAALETSLSELQLVNRNIEGSPVVGEVPSEVTSDVPNSNHGDQEKEQLLLSLQEEYGKEKAMLEQELSLVKLVSKISTSFYAYNTHCIHISTFCLRIAFLEHSFIYMYNVCT